MFFGLRYKIMHSGCKNVGVSFVNGPGSIQDTEKRIIALCILLSLFVFIVDICIPLGVAGGVPHIIAVLISLWSTNKRLPMYVAVGGSLLTMIGFFFSPEGGEVWKVLANRFLALLAIWVVAILTLQRKKIQDEKEKAVFDLKILSGLLPICSSCKKIRDDDGCWNQIESYIRKYSEAGFSHGICEECAAKLYPGIDLHN